MNEEPIFSIWDKIMMFLFVLFIIPFLLIINQEKKPEPIKCVIVKENI
tara:strand:- start:572 stop:715 length:144 start_codon:yes stop_codon:yes gene_type:complete